MHYTDIEDNLIASLEGVVKSALSDLKALRRVPPHSLIVEFETPKEKSHGDLATSIAMRVSKAASKEPLVFAEMLKERFEKRIQSSGLKWAVDHIETKPPGFINLFLSREYLCKVLLEIERRRRSFGRCGIGRGIKVVCEFVSANPTGPLTIAHGRQAAIGDSLADILEFAGYSVTREYYINDEGSQMDMLANSVRVRYLELFSIMENFPKDGYRGTYIIDIAKAVRKRYGKKFLHTKDIKVFREFALNWIMNDIKKDLKAFGVKFDVWYSQRALRRSGKIEKAILLLKKKGYVYQKDGAVWFKSQPLGDDKDRVVFKSDGAATYLAPDIAYHLDKYRRGFKRIIDIWGPDHHGYVPRIKAAIKALGYSEGSLSVLIVQLATLFKNGQQVSMSTRAGEFVTLREVMDEVGKDATRFSLMMRRLSSHLDFDLDLVKKESLENPVYYIQYAHARIWSILEHAKKAKASTKFDSGLLKETEEIELLKALRQFPKVTVSAANSLEPYVILQYLQDLAAAFHFFYTKHRVVSGDSSLTKARVVLVNCVRQVLANGLNLLGVSLPKKM